MDALKPWLNLYQIFQHICLMLTCNWITRLTYKATTGTYQRNEFWCANYKITLKHIINMSVLLEFSFEKSCKMINREYA